MFEISYPSAFLIIGMVIFLYPRHFNSVFSKLGKAIWRMTTFGVTDMKWFYPENENPILFRRMGFVFVTIGVIHLTIILVSYYGPNSLALIRESEIYLKEKNDSLNGLNLSFQTSSEPENLIHYRLNHKDGKLIAKWEEDKYVFTELNQ